MRYCEWFLLLSLVKFSLSLLVSIMWVLLLVIPLCVNFMDPQVILLYIHIWVYDFSDKTLFLLFLGLISSGFFY